MPISYKIKQIDIDNEEKLNSFIKELLQIYNFHDIFEANESIDIKPHIHTDYESRLFISGSAEFKIDNSIIECSKGSYIEIEAGVSHSFKYTGGEPLKVIRFFSSNDSWKAIYC